MKILLLSSYNTPSHSYWAKSLINTFPEYKWTYLKLPARKFSWRIRGNPLSWMANESSVLLNNYDTIVATSMVDLSTIIGLFPNLGKAKKIYYFHENQFEYPLSSKKNHSNVESMMVNLYGALAADIAVFNSEYNMKSFFSGAEKLLKKINDHSPVSILDNIRYKVELLPVPIALKNKSSTKKIPRSIIWNHRWEYDKNPEDYYNALRILKGKNIDFKLIMMGIQFKNSPMAFENIKNDFKENILCWGEQSKSDYFKWLSKGEFTISTAIHEFQGLAVMEAVQMGAIPIVPNRLSYPQWFPKENIYEESPQDLATKLEISFLEQPKIPNLYNLSWDYLKDNYRKLIIN